MSMDKEVCKVVYERWFELGYNGAAPSNLEFFKVHGKLSKNASVIALIMDGATQQPVAVAKIPRNPACTTGIDAEYSAMEVIRAGANSWVGSDSIPYQGFIADIQGLRVLIQRAIPGYTLVRDMTTQQSIHSAYSKALPWMMSFHNSAAKEVKLEGDVLQNLVAKPIDLFLSEVGALENVNLSETITTYFNGLADKVGGSVVKLCHKHGDFNAHNILVTNDIKSGGLFVIDWEDYQADQLPIHDLNHFFISNSKLLDMHSGSTNTFEDFILKDGWYQNDYYQMIKSYEDKGFIKFDVFQQLTPLYMAEICLSMMSEHRQQEGTINIWLTRMEGYINAFLR